MSIPASTHARCVAAFESLRQPRQPMSRTIDIALRGNKTLYCQATGAESRLTLPERAALV